MAGAILVALGFIGLAFHFWPLLPLFFISPSPSARARPGGGWQRFRNTAQVLTNDHSEISSGKPQADGSKPFDGKRV